MYTHQWWPGALLWLLLHEPQLKPARCTRMCEGYRSGWGHPSGGPLKNLMKSKNLLTSIDTVCISKAVTQALVFMQRSYLNGSVSCTSRAAPRIRPSFRAWARAFSSTSPPLDVFTRNAPWRICQKSNRFKLSTAKLAIKAGEKSKPQTPEKGFV